MSIPPRSHWEWVNVVPELMNKHCCTITTSLLDDSVGGGGRGIEGISSKRAGAYGRRARATRTWIGDDECECSFGQ